MAATKIKSGDLLLLLFYVSGKTEKNNEPIQGRTRLLKMIVAFEEELFDDFKKDNDILSKDDLPEFFAWNFGPMSTKVLEDLQFFTKIQFVKSRFSDSIGNEEVEEMSAILKDLDEKNDEEEYQAEEYYLSPIGVKYVEGKLLELLTQNQVAILKKLKKQFNSASLHQILSYIYNNDKYKKYIKEDKSKIYDSYVKK